jgi:hypothetical protein
VNAVRLGSDPRSAARRPAEAAELLGQVLTPFPLALDMARALMRRRPPHPAAILDPAAGPATFPAALAQTGLLTARDEITLYDVDPRMAERAASWSETSPYRCGVFAEDYLAAECGRVFDLAILNPPYVRQEWIDRKESYRGLFLRRYGVRVPGTANLYVYFLVKAVRDLKPGGHLACIVYDSWQSTRFGAWLWTFLGQECESVERVPVPGQPFQGRLIDATILYARRRTTAAGEPADGSAARTRAPGSPLSAVPGLVPVADLFHTRRGLRLKQADFFRGGRDDVARHGATPFVKKGGGIPGYRVPDGHPESALLASPQHADPRVLRELERRLAAARANPEDNVSVLTWFRERPESWALHREPPHAPFLFNYYLRHRPRHLYNPHRAYADNFYGLTPTCPIAPQAALALLNSTCFCVEILAQARNQGSGLAKVQLYEYRQARLPDWRLFGETTLRRLERCGSELTAGAAAPEAVLEKIDDVIAAELGHLCLGRWAVRELYHEVDRLAKSPGGRP